MHLQCININNKCYVRGYILGIATPPGIKDFDVWRARAGPEGEVTVF